MKQFRNKVAVVTGAGSGIGRALAQALAREGCRLALSDVRLESVQETVTQCAALGAEARAYALDVANRDAVYAHAEAVKADFGSVNLVINNAGVDLAASVQDMSWEDFEWLMGIDFWGVAYGSKAFLPHLIASGDGHLVNISSIFGMIGVPMQSAYNAAKFAVRGYTEALRQELLIAKLPVQVSAVHPGGIRTNIVQHTKRSAALADLDVDRLFERFARTSAEQAAAIILAGIRADRPRIFVGLDARLVDLIQRLAGHHYQTLICWLIGRMSARKT